MVVGRGEREPGKVKGGGRGEREDRREGHWLVVLKGSGEEGYGWEGRERRSVDDPLGGTLRQGRLLMTLWKEHGGGQ